MITIVIQLNPHETIIIESINCKYPQRKEIKIDADGVLITTIRQARK